MSDLPTAVTAYVTALADADSAPPWARIMREDVAAARMRELLAACFADDISLDDALIAHAPDFVRKQAEEWTAMAARIAPPAPVVLGPWRPYPEPNPDGMVRRVQSGDDIDELGLRLYRRGWYASTGRLETTGEETGREGQDAADKWARAQGWVLLDAEPLHEPAILQPWKTGNAGARFRSAHKHNVLFCAIFVDSDGWRVVTRGALYPEDDVRNFAAHGPQTGAEGERLAMVAALALGFVEGT